MNFLKGLIDMLRVSPSPDLADSAIPPHAPSNRFHLFCGTFPSELDATAYCLDTNSANEPEPLTRDLPDAMIDTSMVEIIYGTRVDAAVQMLDPSDAASLTERIGEANTLILISERAFGGLPYTLNDTPVLEYLGPFDLG